jgi:hypothetical protein
MLLQQQPMPQQQQLLVLPWVMPVQEKHCNLPLLLQLVTVS